MTPLFRKRRNGYKKEKPLRNQRFFFFKSIISFFKYLPQFQKTIINIYNHLNILYAHNHIKTKLLKSYNAKIDKLNNEYESLEVAAKLNNIKNKGNITLVCQHKRKNTGGFIWKYKN